MGNRCERPAEREENNAARQGACMSFPASAYLRTATSRTKSDVANKLVSMFLHDLSRKICASLKLSITDAQYAEAVEAAFGSNCGYCYRPLEKDRTSVEHLEGMNRFRLGLHITGNVILACKRGKEKSVATTNWINSRWRNTAGSLFSRTTQRVVGRPAIPAATGECFGRTQRSARKA